jgi:A/G-specific adenine glycosylase
MARREGLTSVLPESKPKRLTPTRTTTMLIVRDAQARVLLERRPPTGVWARLWSLPEIDDTTDAIDHLHARYAVSADTPESLTPFVHTFSHFHLHITPVLLIGAPIARRVGDDVDRRWIAQAQLHTLGLPAPVRTLLDTLLTGNAHA